VQKIKLASNITLTSRNQEERRTSILGWLYGLSGELSKLAAPGALLAQVAIDFLLLGLVRPLARNGHASIHAAGVIFELLIIVLEAWGFVSVCVRRFRNFRSRGPTAASIGLLLGAGLYLIVQIIHHAPLDGAIILCLCMLMAF